MWETPDHGTGCAGSISLVAASDVGFWGPAELGGASDLGRRGGLGRPLIRTLGWSWL